MAATAEPMALRTPLRRRVYEILEVGRAGDYPSLVADVVLITLVTANIAAVILQSIESIDRAYRSFFVNFEIISVAIFSLEFALRIWVAPEDPSRPKEAWRARVNYLFSPMALADLAAIAPFYWTANVDADLRFFRIMRLLRALKLTRYFAALASFGTVFRIQRAAFATSFALMFLVLIFSASFMYVVEHEAQPEAFSSIPAAMWWAVCTLTTVGYGDVTPITAAGKLLAAGLTIVGIGMVALPTSILASGFAEVHRRNQRALKANAREAMGDGIVDASEKSAYRELARQLGVDPQEAQRILELTRREGAPAQGHSCPHCGRAG